jgi:hypothetical protein
MKYELQFVFLVVVESVRNQTTDLFLDMKEDDNLNNKGKR